MSKTEEVKLPSPGDLGTTISYHNRFGGGIKKHKEATIELIEAKGVTNKKRVNVQVSLFDSPYLDSAKKKGQALRNWINARSLPWGDDGRRFLPNAIKTEVDSYCMKEVASIDVEMEKHFALLPQLEESWNSEGGGLANTGIKFPTEDECRRKYRIDIVPGVVTHMDDIRVGGLTDDQRERFVSDVLASQERKVRKTVDHVQDRLKDVLSNMVDRLGKYGKDEDGKVTGKFHDSLIGNCRDLAGLLEHFNITKDPEIEAVRRRIINELCHNEPGDLRESEELRDNVRKSASDILSRVGSFGMKRKD